MGVVRPRALDRHEAEQLVGVVRRRPARAPRERRAGAGRELLELRADRREAGRLVGVAMVDDARDVGLHHRAAERLVVDALADRGLDQVRAGEEDRAGALDDVDLVAHDRQVGAAGDAGADDRRHLEDARRRQAGVVVEDPAVVLAVGEDLVLQRQEDAGRVDQVDDRQPVLERDLLRPQDLLDAERELGAGLDRGVVGDHHHVATVDHADARHHARRRGAAPLGVHAVRGPQAELEEGANPGRRAPRPARAPSACPARAAGPAPSRRRRGAAPPPRPPAARARPASGSARRSNVASFLSPESRIATAPPVSRSAEASYRTRIGAPALRYDRRR